MLLCITLCKLFLTSTGINTTLLLTIQVNRSINRLYKLHYYINNLIKYIFIILKILFIKNYVNLM